MPRSVEHSTAERPRVLSRMALITLAVLTLSPSLLVSSAAAQDTSVPDSDPVDVAVRSGEAWLAGAQQPDGGFALGGLPAVETPEALLALTAAAQTESTWSTRETIDRFEALEHRGGPTALDAVDVLARNVGSPVDAAILITRVALPSRLDPRAFDPVGTQRPIDLVAVLDTATPEARTAGLAQVIVAHVALGNEAPAPLVEAVVEAQLGDGGWSTDDSDESDPVATSAAITALIAAGLATDDARVSAAVDSLTSAQLGDGGWGPDETSTPTATAAAMQALLAVGYVADGACWLEEGDDRPTPTAALLALQREDGYWGTGDETYTTSAAVQALTANWLPLSRTEEITCGGGFEWPLPTVPPSLVVVVGIGIVGTVGAFRILRGSGGGF